jgi:hypothetical protein
MVLVDPAYVCRYPSILPDERRAFLLRQYAADAP